VAVPEDADGPPAASLGPERRAAEAALLVRLLPGGVEADEYPVRDHGVLTLGREDCDLTFPEDTLLSARHASLVHDGEDYLLRDDGSATGVFLRVPATEKIEIEGGDVLCAGRQFLLVTEDDGRFSLTHYDAAGREAGRHPLPERTVILGRRAPDVTLDPDDKTLSRRQMAVTVAGGKAFVKDLKSVNGTYVRVRGSRKIGHGQQFRAGQQRFAFSLRGDAVIDAGHDSFVGALPVPSAAPEAPSAVAAGAPSVTFRGLGKTCPVAPGQTICAVAEAQGLAINAECHSGICGSDPIRIVSGAEHLEGPPSAQESETLADLCDLEAGEHRLACMARVKGPVVVEIL
jgi:pSer/pThr/pTyr-binding forkhead associated (FHA) protein/ferredoxin